DYQLDAAAQKLLFNGVQRRDAAPITDGTTLTYSFMNTTSPALYVISTGVWSQTQAQATSATLPWNAATFFSRPAMLDGAHHDALFFAGFDLHDPTFYVLDEYFRHPDFSLIPGSGVGVAASLLPVALDHCTHLVVPVTELRMRAKPLVRGDIDSTAVLVVA